MNERQLEDVLKKYGIDSVQELDKILSHYKYLGDHNYQALPKDDFDALFGELSYYKDLEDKLGIRIEILFKALANGYLRRGVNPYGWYDKRYKVVKKVQRYDCGIDLRKKCLYEKGDKGYDERYMVYFADYGVTWTLEGEDFMSDTFEIIQNHKVRFEDLFVLQVGGYFIKEYYGRFTKECLTSDFKEVTLRFKSWNEASKFRNVILAQNDLFWILGGEIKIVPIRSMVVVD